MDGLRAWWDSLTPNGKNFVIGIASSVAAALVVGWLGYVFRKSVMAIGRRIFASEVTNTTSSAQPPIVIEVRTPAAPPSLPPVEDAEPAKVVTPTPLPEFLRPPAYGFVARRDDQGHDIIGRLKEELTPGRNKLVTLLGAGGVGKTTLAVEAFRVLGETYEVRLVWSDATGRVGYTLSTLLDEVATQLGRTELRALALEAKEAAVRAFVVEHPTLVVLDNYETVEEAERGRIVHWLARTQCCALITSREKIKDTLNVVIPTMPPDEAQKFLEARIAATQDRQLFTPEVRQRIYETAEGNPFLMEWVVAQVDDAKEPGTVLEELKHGEGDAAERVFGRSFNLPQVGEDGRAVLLALSLFVPSASRPALAAVAGFGDDEKRLGAAIKSLHALWLVKGLDGNRRFTVEGLTRSLTSARLSKEGREDEFRQRFITYFLQYAVSHRQKTPEDYDALEAERDNLLSATDAAFAREDWGSVVRMAYPMDEMLSVRGYWNEALSVDELALRAARSSQDETQVANLAHIAAVMYQSRGELEEARRLYDESLEINKRLGDQSGVAATLHQLGRLAQDQGELDEARRLFNESLEIEKQLGNQGGIAISLSTLGRLEKAEGNVPEAVRLLSESLSIFERLGSPKAEVARRVLKGLKDES
jgi:tetratricopeptide (TPR) repeat protein